MIIRNKLGQFTKGCQTWLGKHLSKEHVNKFHYHLGKPLSEETKNKISIKHKGIKFTEEHKLKLSISHKEKKENHWNWKGGITPENDRIRVSIESRLWRNSIFARDNWTCQKCNKKSSLNSHHIQNFSEHPELRFALDNGITFCKECHLLFHKKYGIYNNNKKQIYIFVNNSDKITNLINPEDC